MTIMPLPKKFLKEFKMIFGMRLMVLLRKLKPNSVLIYERKN